MDALLAAAAQMFALVLPTLATVLATLAVAALNRYLQKLGVDLTAAQAARLKQIATDAIQATEEQAHREPIPSREKALLALQLVQQTAPDIDPRTAQRAIDAALPEVRAKLAPTFVPAAQGFAGG